MIGDKKSTLEWQSLSEVKVGRKLHPQNVGQLQNDVSQD